MYYEIIPAKDYSCLEFLLSAASTDTLELSATLHGRLGDSLAYAA